MLVQCISKYNFNASHEKSEGYYDNLNTKHILFQLSLLRRHIYDMLLYIDNYMYEGIHCLETSYIYQILEDISKNIMEIINDLTYREFRYHELWAMLKGRIIPYEPVNMHDLGYNKKSWKLARNNALEYILSFTNKLNNIKWNIIKQKGYEEWLSGEPYRIWLSMLDHSTNKSCYVRIKEESK